MSSIKFSNSFNVVTNDIVEANELQFRADLNIVLRDIVEGKGWKQTDAAEAFKLSQPRVKELADEAST